MKKMSRNLQVNCNVSDTSSIQENFLQVKMRNRHEEKILIAKDNRNGPSKINGISHKNFILRNQELFLQMNSKRKAVVETFNEDIETLQTDCLRWKRQLDAQTDSNRLLQKELKPMLDDYKKILEKTKHDNNIVLRLKDSEHELKLEEAKSLKLNKQLETTFSIKDDLLEDKNVLEKERNYLISCLEDHNKKLKQINDEHRILQKNITREWESADNYIKKRAEISGQIQDVFSRLENTFKQFDELYESRDKIVDSVQAYISKGLMSCLRETEECTKNADPDSESNQETETPVDEHSDEIGSRSEVEESDEISSVKENTSGQKNPNSTDESIELDEEIVENKKPIDSSIIKDLNLRMIKEENRFLSEMYLMLNDKLESLSDELFQLKRCCDDVESINKKMVDKSEDLENIISRKRRAFIMPERNAEKEVNARIQEQKNENVALNNLLTECFSFKAVTSKVYASFRENVLEIYKSMLNEANDTEKVEDETITEVETS